MQEEINADGQCRLQRGGLKNKRALQAESVGGRVLYICKRLRMRVAWPVLFIAALVPAFAQADMVEIGWLDVKSTCQPAARSPAHGLVCTGSVTLFNETSTSEMYGIGFNVGGVTHIGDMPPLFLPQIIGPLGGEDVQFQDAVDWFKVVPAATVLSVQAELINAFSPTFIVEDLGGPNAVAGTFSLTSGAFTTNFQSPQFDADFQGDLSIFVDAIPVTPVVTPGAPSAPEPGTLGLMPIALALVFFTRRHFLDQARKQRE